MAPRNWRAVAWAALAARCPRCGAGELFDGFLTPKQRCAVCGLDLSGEDSGDGPAAFVVLIVGFLVVGAAFWVERTFGPPLWLHLVLWLPATLGMSLLSMRPIKAALIVIQYHTRDGDLGADGD